MRCAALLRSFATRSPDPRPITATATGHIAVFQITIFLSAFLLFLVQPLLAKQILPWFGGSAAVWTTCMLFFQTLLLAGYAYAHWLVVRPSPRLQLRIHAALVLLSLLAVFSLGSMTAPPAGSQPTLSILRLLTLAIGLPYFVLATSGPLLQAWFARAHPGSATYRLYALSNFGSFLGLLSYPLLLEPLLHHATITRIWQTLYAVLAMALLAIAVAAARVGSNMIPPRAEVVARQPTGWRPPLYWLVLAMTSSVLLLSVTAHLTQDVASIPFLWVLPLAMYLLAFIFAFDRESWYRPAIFLPLTLLLTLLMAAGLTETLHFHLLHNLTDIARDPFVSASWSTPDVMPAVQAIPLFTLGVLVLCWFCNGELVRHKPPTDQLTWFYLVIAAGGALGALLVSVVGPLLLPGYFELPAVLIFLALLCTFRAHGWWRVLASIPTLLVLLFAVRYTVQLHSETIAIVRDFYGVFRVEQSTGNDSASEISTKHNANDVRSFFSGVILHGDQRLDATSRRVPTEYYTPSSGVGRTLHLLTQPTLHVGLIGLGVGTLAAYGRTGDRYDFYEINPDVLAIAHTYFTYLGDSRARTSVVLGDARLSLARQSPQHFDLLVVDAFSSDAIPVHLLTREAMREYARHVSPDGVIAFHLSNTELTLMPIVQDLANAIGRRAVLVSDATDDDDELTSDTDWVMVTNNRLVLDGLLAAPDGLLAAPDAHLLRPEIGFKPWTDDYSSLLQVWQPFRNLSGLPNY